MMIDLYVIHYLFWQLSIKGFYHIPVHLTHLLTPNPNQSVVTFLTIRNTEY